MIYVFQGRYNTMDMHRLAVVAESEEAAREKAEPYLAEQRRLDAERIDWYDRAWKGLKPNERNYGPEIIAKFGPVPPGGQGTQTIGDLLETHEDIYVVEDCLE